jgi:hypothetical protein
LRLDPPPIADTVVRDLVAAASLVVTVGPAAEHRVVDALLAAEVGQPRRLPLLTTTVDLLITAEGGPFEPIWRDLGTRGIDGLYRRAATLIACPECSQNLAIYHDIPGFGIPLSQTPSDRVTLQSL